MKNLPLTWALLTLALLGCVAPAPHQSSYVETTRVFNRPFDQVWGAAVSEISANYSLKVIDKASGVAETDLSTIGAGFGSEAALKSVAISPAVFLGTWSRARAKLSVYARPNGTNTLLRVRAHVEGFENNVSHSWYVWPSNGSLEVRIIDQIDKAL